MFAWATLGEGRSARELSLPHPPGTRSACAPGPATYSVGIDELLARLASAVDSAPRLLEAGGWFRRLSQTPLHRPPGMSSSVWTRGMTRPPPIPASLVCH